MIIKNKQGYVLLTVLNSKFVPRGTGAFGNSRLRFAPTILNNFIVLSIPRGTGAFGANS